MKILYPFFLLCCATLLAQPNTEVYLIDLVKSGENYELGSPVNISKNEGYDSQPSFVSDSVLLFAGTRNGATEIIRYIDGKQAQLNFPTSGGEYSPQSIPDSDDISAVRLDTTGYQRLYRYPKNRRKPSTELVSNAVVAYYTWADANTIVAADIVNGKLHLVLHDIKDKVDTDLKIEVGRSFHKIPDTELVSFIDKSQKQWTVNSINPKTQKINTVAPLPGNSEDICWLPDGTLLLAKDEILFKFDKKINWWVPFKEFSDPNLWNISRITSNPSGTKLAIVSEVSPAVAVEKHIEPYNKQNLDAFINAFSKNVVVRNFFADTTIVGQENLKNSYEKWFKKNQKVNVQIQQRIVINNVVVDEEISTSDNGKKRNATIYEVNNGAISSMTFVNDTPTRENLVAVIDSQLEAYNKGDIDAFMEHYSQDIELYQYPNTRIMPTREAMKANYQGMFERVPDLHCTIKNRIIVGNRVIDYEELSASGQKWYAVAIYEVANNKITRVTFIQ